MAKMPAMRFPERLLSLLAVLTLTMGTIQAQSKLKFDVFTSGPKTLQSNSTIIEGPHFVLLVDAPLTQSDAAKLVEKIKATGKTLMAIYITTPSPEHFFGLNTIKAAFPHAKVWSIPATITGINANYTNEVTAWKPIIGPTEVPDHVIQVFPAPAASIILDNEQVEIHGPEQGAAEGIGYLYIPSAKTIIAGDLVYGNVHPWIAGTNSGQRKAWLDALDRLKKVGASVIIAGHKDPASGNDAAAIDGTANYLRTWEKAIKMAHSADELIGIIEDQFPDLKGLDTAMKVAANKQFPEQN